VRNFNRLLAECRCLKAPQSDCQWLSHDRIPERAARTMQCWHALRLSLPSWLSRSPSLSADRETDRHCERSSIKPATKTPGLCGVLEFNPVSNLANERSVLAVVPGVTCFRCVCCVLALMLAYFSCVTCVACVKKVRKGLSCAVRVALDRN